MRTHKGKLLFTVFAAVSLLVTGGCSSLQEVDVGPAGSFGPSETSPAAVGSQDESPDAQGRTEGGTGNVQNSGEITENPDDTSNAETVGNPGGAPKESEAESGGAPAASSSEDFSFKNLEPYRFSFSSGAGGWRTELQIRGDGSFSGVYLDSNMGDTGEGYPGGTTNYCKFSGQLTAPVKVDAYTYSTKIQQIQYENEPGTEEILDGVLYQYSDVYGLEDAEDILIYLPGTPVSELSEEFLSWMHPHLANSGQSSGDALPFYALNNAVHQEGFAAYDIKDTLENTVRQAETEAQEIGNLLEAAGDQAEKDSLSGDLYTLWDNTLNTVWEDLTDLLSQEAMTNLTREEKEWIAWKEGEVKKAGEEAEDDSLYTFVTNRKAAELTEARVYALLELAD